MFTGRRRSRTEDDWWTVDAMTTMLKTIMSQQDGEFDGLTMFDGLDSAFIGIGESHTSKPRAIYSEALIIKALEEQGMDEDRKSVV
jgi:DNA topoisomerase IA